jgi:hypothetical protein
MKPKKFVTESLSEYMEINDEMGAENPMEYLLVSNQDWLEDNEASEIALEVMTEYIPLEDLYWVGYGDPMDEEEEERVEKIVNLSRSMTTVAAGIPIGGPDLDGGEITVHQKGNVFVIEWFDNAHDSNWFTNSEGLRMILGV